MAEGGILSVDINNSMMRYVNKSHSLYIQELEKNKKHQTEAEKKWVARKRLMLTQKPPTGEKSSTFFCFKCCG